MDKSNLNFASIFHQLPEGITIQDPSGKLVFANQSALELMGYPRKEKKDTSLRGEEVVKKFIIMDEDGKVVSADKLPGRKVLQTGKPQEALLRFRTTAGRKEYWSWVKSMPLSENGGLTGVVNVFYDVTKWKQTEYIERLLNEVSSASSSLDYEIRLKKITEVVVSTLADWCAIDVIDESGVIKRMALSHRGFKNNFLTDQQYPTVTEQANLISQIITRSKPYYYVKSVGKESDVKNEKDFSLQFTNSSIKSAAILPLITRDRTLGTISFGYTDIERYFDSYDRKVLDNVAAKAALLFDNARLFQAAQKVIRDQRQTNRELLESENTLQIALDVGNMGVWDWDLHSDTFTWSDGLKPLYGSRKGISKGTLKTFLEHVYYADRARVGKKLKMAVKKKKEFVDEFRVVWTNGSVHWMHKKGQVLCDGNAMPVRVIGIGIDITDRKVSEVAIKLSEKKFHSIFNTSIDAIVITNKSMKIIDANPSACTLFQMTRKELLSRRISDMATIEERKKMVKLFKKLQQNKAQKGEVIIHQREDSHRVIEYSAHGQFLQDRFLFIMRDISDRKEEEQRREHLLGITSHELRTPLASIKAFTEILKRRSIKNKDSLSEEYLQKIDEKTITLTRLVNDLLDVARIRQGKLDFYYELFSVDEFIKDVIRDIKLTVPAYNLILKGSVRKEMVADKNRISQIVINLVKNAAKYSPHNKNIIIRVAKRDESVLLSVQDFGVGIPKNAHKKIFDIFYRIDNKTKKRVYGLGVGLFITSQIVKMHGGKIWLKSKVNSGSTFFVSLPLLPKKKNR